MKNLENTLLKVKAYQQRINLELDQLALPKTPDLLYEPIKYFIGIGGKRMRPVLTLMACELFNENPNLAIPQAIGLELFHNFTLMHDDIMDNAPIRRNKQTVHEKYNANVGILSGDALFVKASQYIANAPEDILGAILQVYLNTALEVCEGQQMDMDFEQIENVSLSDYIKMIELKTSVLLGCCMKIGALVGGASEKEADLLYSFGLNTGIAFQIQDDILDVFGDPEKFGKIPGGDIIANKKTWLMLKAMELSKNDETKILKQAYFQNKFSKEEKVNKVTELFESLGVRILANYAMNNYLNVAFDALNQLNVSENKKQELKEFAQYLVQREE